MTSRVDYHAIFEDFAHLGLTGDELAAKLRVHTKHLQRLATAASEPSGWTRMRIEGLWCHLTGKMPEFLPRTTVPEGTPQPEVPNIDSNEEQEPAFVHLDAALRLWHQLTG